MNGDYIPAIITASVALIVAIGVQFLSHLLSNRRDVNKRRDIIYQEFIFPILPEVLLYYDIETNFRKGHDVEREVNIIKLLQKISEKVSHGNMELLSTYYDIKEMEYFFDGRGFGKERNILRFMFWYLDYVLEILMKKSSNVKGFIVKIENKQKLYGLWFLIAEESELPQATELMQFDFLLSNDSIQDINIEQMKELVGLDINSDIDINRHEFLQRIIAKWEVEAGEIEIPIPLEIRKKY